MLVALSSVLFPDEVASVEFKNGTITSHFGYAFVAKKNGTGISHGYRNNNVFEKLRLQNQPRLISVIRKTKSRRQVSNSFGLKTVFENFLFCDGSVWTGPHRKPRLMQALAGKPLGCRDFFALVLDLPIMWES